MVSHKGSQSEVHMGWLLLQRIFHLSLFCYTGWLLSIHGYCQFCHIFRLFAGKDYIVAGLYHIGIEGLPYTVFLCACSLWILPDWIENEMILNFWIGFLIYHNAGRDRVYNFWYNGLFHFRFNARIAPTCHNKQECLCLYQASRICLSIQASQVFTTIQASVDTFLQAGQITLYFRRALFFSPNTGERDYYQQASVKTVFKRGFVFSLDSGERE